MVDFSNFLTEDSISAYDFSAGMKAGDTFRPGAPYPEAKVIENSVEEAKKIVLQTSNLILTDFAGRTQELTLIRLLAIMASGKELEISRTSVDTRVITEQLSGSGRCNCCQGVLLKEDSIRAKSGEWYHKHCY